MLVLSSGQRNEVDLRSGEKHCCRPASRPTACWPTSAACAIAETRPPKAMRTIDLVRQPSPRNQGELVWRLGLVLRCRQPAAAGHRPGGHQPAPRQQLEPAVRAAGLRRLLQPDQPLAGLGGQRSLCPCGVALAVLHGARLPGRRWLLLWWREHAAVFSFKRRPGAKGCHRSRAPLRTVRRLLYPRHHGSSVLFVALAFLSLFFFIDFVDELDGVGKRGQAHGLARGAGGGASNCPGISTNCCRSRC